MVGSGGGDGRGEPRLDRVDERGGLPERSELLPGAITGVQLTSGAAKAIGLVPNTGLAPPQGAIAPGVLAKSGSPQRMIGSQR